MPNDIPMKSISALRRHVYIFINTMCIYNINTCIRAHSSERNAKHSEWKSSVGLYVMLHLTQDFHQYSALSCLSLLYCWTALLGSNYQLAASCLTENEAKRVFCWKIIWLYLLPIRINVLFFPVLGKGFNMKRAGLVLLQIQGFLGPRNLGSPKQDMLYLELCGTITQLLILSSFPKFIFCWLRSFLNLPWRKWCKRVDWL